MLVSSLAAQNISQVRMQKAKSSVQGDDDSIPLSVGP